MEVVDIDAIKKPETIEHFDKAQAAHDAECLAGSPDKDAVDECHGKVIGGELDPSPYTRSLGLTTLAAPLRKRLALSYVSLVLCGMTYTTDALHACLLGGWINTLLYRRPLMCVFDKVFGLIDMAEVDKDA